MKKIINIDVRDVAFVANGALPLRFMQETDKDLFEIAMPILNALIPVAQVLLPVMENKKNKKDDLVTNSMMAALASEIDLEKILYKLSALDVMTLVYVMAKEGNPEIKDMMAWYASFDRLPAYEILKELIPLLTETFRSKVKSKNAKAAAAAAEA